MTLRYGLAFVVALALSAALTRLTIGICARHGWVSMPRTDRWHSGSPALFGGLPIVLAFCLTSVFLLPLAYNPLWVVIGLSVSFCGVGFYDDVWSLRPLGKLALQLLGAGILIRMGVLYQFRDSIWINITFTVVWVVGITNAFNLLDNIDGLASGIAIIWPIFTSSLTTNRQSCFCRRLSAPFWASLFLTSRQQKFLWVTQEVSLLVFFLRPFLPWEQPISAYMGPSCSCPS